MHTNEGDSHATTINNTEHDIAEAITPKRYGKANIAEAVAKLPEVSERVLEDVPLVDNGSLGVRMFRVYGPVPRHQHQYSDTYMHIVSGRGEFAVEDEPSFEAGAGDMVYWVRGTDHQVVRVIEEPLVVYAIDSPTRRPGDVVFYTDNE